MFFEEWPLLTFSLLSQTAAGMFFLLALLRSLLPPAASPARLDGIRAGIAAVGPLLGLAMLLSFFHLGSPTGALAASPNPDSWMVREVLATSLFLGLWGVCFLLSRKNRLNAGLQWVTAFAGMAAVFFMAGAYTHSIRPAWIHLNTYLTFFGATLILGAPPAVLAFATKTRETMDSAKALRFLVVVAGAAVLLPLLYQPVFLSALSTGETAAQASARLYTGNFLPVVALRWLLALTGLAALIYGVYVQTLRRKPIQVRFLYWATGLIVVGEGLGRYLFFATAVSTRIGLSNLQ